MTIARRERHARELEETQLDLFGPPVAGGRTPDVAGSSLLSADGSMSMAATGIPPRIAAVVDEQLFRRGELSLIECLRSLGFLDATPAQTGPDPAPGIPELLRGTERAAVEALDLVLAYASAQGLVDAVPDAAAGKSARSLEELCRRILRPATTRAQADMFQDSAATVAIHAIRRALAEHRLAEVPELLAQLPQELEVDRAQLARLAQAAELPAGAVAQRLDDLERNIAPLARRQLGAMARAYLEPLWTRLAQDLLDAPYVATAADLHASYAYLRAGRWGDVIAASRAVTGWMDQPVLIGRVAEACARIGDKAAARQTWAQLCWRHPQAAEDLMAEAPGDPHVARQWAAFRDAEMAFEAQDFPAWLLVADPQQAGLVPVELAPGNDTGKGYALLHAVVTTGGGMPQRKSLHQHCPALLRLFIARLPGDKLRTA